MPTLRPWTGTPHRRAAVAEPVPRPEALEPLESWIQQDRRARLLVRASGELLWISAAARESLSDGAPLVIDEGWLTGATQQASQHLQLLLRSVSAAAPCWFLEEGDALIWAQHIAPSEPDCIGLTIRRAHETFDVSALAEARRLTTAQSRILSLMLSGLEAARIAEELDISVETLRTHIKHLYRKLGVNSRGSLFAMAMLFMPV